MHERNGSWARWALGIAVAVVIPVGVFAAGVIDKAVDRSVRNEGRSKANEKDIEELSESFYQVGKDVAQIQGDIRVIRQIVSDTDK